MEIRNISLLQARSIRREVLRPGRPESEVAYPGDASEFAQHLGAFEGDKLIGVATEAVRGAFEAWQPYDQRSVAEWVASSCRMASSAYCARELLSYGATVAHLPVLSTNVTAFARRGRSLHYPIRGRTTSSYCMLAERRSELTVRGEWLCHERGNQCALARPIERPRATAQVHR